jgi:hypothetical protein
VNSEIEGKADVREVAAVFPSEEAFSVAIDALQSSGVDQARISVLAAGTPEVGERLTAAGFHKASDLLDAEGVPRTVYEQPEDFGAAKGLTISGLLYVGATLGAGIAAATVGAIVAPMLVAAAASGAAGAGLGAVLTKNIGSRRTYYIEQSLSHGGLVLWVVAKDAHDEKRITRLLVEHGGTNVHVHEIEHGSNGDRMLPGDQI